MIRVLAAALARQVLLADGAMEPRLREIDLDVQRDLFGANGCTDLLTLTRANQVRALHEEQLRAGADLVRTNTRCASPLELQRFNLGEDAFALNYAAAQLASAAVDAVPGDGRRRFVLGMVCDLGWEVAPREIEDAADLQVSALIAGGADGIALDIRPGLWRSPAFLRGALRAKAEARSVTGIFLQCSQALHQACLALRRSADGVILYRALRLEDMTGFADALQHANLIAGGGTADETAALDRRLRAATEEGLRPRVAWSDRPDSPGESPLPTDDAAPAGRNTVISISAARRRPP